MKYALSSFATLYLVLGTLLAAPVEPVSHHMVSAISEVRYLRHYMGHVHFDEPEDQSITRAIEEHASLIEYMLPADVQGYLHEITIRRQRMLLRDALDYIGTYCEERPSPPRSVMGCEAALRYTINVCGYEECNCVIPNDIEVRP